LWRRPAPPPETTPQKEKKQVIQTVTIVTPEGERFGADVAADTLVGQLIRAFVGQWRPAAEGPTRYVLRPEGAERPALGAAVTLQEADVPDGAELWLTAQRLGKDDPVGITIEDERGERFTTAVLLTTTVEELAKRFQAFRAEQEGRPVPDGEVVVELVTGPPDAPEGRRLRREQTLYEAGVSHDALLQIRSAPVGEERKRDD
jgi:hypothetical protein